ncbi:DMT family transporter [Cellulomonas sp. NTE-D12]|uniref:EamA family transporter n=1 Tax=Cellulomonas sp. NTE-D12 TaxID=2962632 RepID=UPI0030816910|nr:membrane protein [Cellulomonas sp. NTE-D12]
MAGLVAAAAFATSGPVAKPLLEAGWTPGGAILFRLSFGALLLVGPALWALRGRYRLLVTERRTLLLFGLVGVAGSTSLYYLAVDRLPIAVALLVEYTAPLLLLGWAWARTRRTPSRLTLVGAALAMGGLVLVLDLTGSIHLDPVGLLFAFAAAVGNAAYFAMTARPSPLPPVAVAGSGLVVGALVIGLLLVVGVLPLRTPAVPVHVAGTTTSWLVLALVLGALPTAFAYGVSTVSVRILGERTASFLALAEVLFAVVLAWALLGEAPAGVQLVGAVLVVGGVALVRRGATDESAGLLVEPAAADVLVLHTSDAPLPDADLREPQPLAV